MNVFRVVNVCDFGEGAGVFPFLIVFDEWNFCENECDKKYKADNV